MYTPTQVRLYGYWRRRLFCSWVVVSVGIGTFVGIAGPVASHFKVGQEVVALSVPLLMLFMMLTGFAWLVAVMILPPPKWGTGKWGGVISTPPRKDTSRMRILEQV